MPKYIFTLFTFIFITSSSTFSQDLDSTKTQPFATQKLSSYVAPAVFIGYGAISFAGNNFIRQLDHSTHGELKEDFPLFGVRLDNYTQYAPLVAFYGLDFLGIKAKHNIVDRSATLVLSTAIMATSVGLLKISTNRLRPNGSNKKSFPSGHTATAFMLAELLNQEYKDKSVWYSVAGYSLATATGVFRMYNKAHWVSDVVAGAGFGLLSTKVAYLIYPEIKKLITDNKSNNLSLSPTYIQGANGFAITYKF
ncbi:phosphatase PAP2 family protein [Pedobacter arcticus]|uniref:phosphatase PAP2 family protein n=1 Tax=Pedobacter arcticus TaxID=752140 RepID=UPI00031BA2F9|nr:phosphatase PAP2 family protein [Pedobacter arcticus]